MSEAEVKRKLLSSRKDLLDIGLRNNLINFRPSAKSLCVVDELSTEVSNILYRQNRPMKFLHMPASRIKNTVAISKDKEQSALLEDDPSRELLHELEGVTWGNDDEKQSSGFVGKRQTDN